MFSQPSNSDSPPRAYTLAIRIVWTDQWLSASFDDSWKVSDLKRWLLHKLSSTDFAPPRARAPSPITFVAQRFEDEEGDGDSWEDGGTFSFEGPSLPPAPVGSSTLKHALMTFSTGLVLEDEARLGWYNLHADELLELHPASCVVRLGRSSVREYVRPYVLARVNVLRYVNPMEPELPAHAHSGKKRKVKLEWKPRWLEINDGQIRILKSLTDPSLFFSAELDNLFKLELPTAHLPHNSPLPSPHCACLNFRSSAPPPSASASPSLFTDPFSSSTPISSPQSDNEPFAGRERQMSADSITSNEEPQNWSALYSPQPRPLHSPSSQDKKGTYLVIDMVDAPTHTHVLRVLHRHAPHNLSSVFVPASCLPYSQTSPTSPISSTSSANVHLHADADGRPPHAYPEWRAALARKAQRAGLGPVPHALAVALYGAGALPSAQTSQTRHSTATIMPFASARFEDDAPPVELEWDNWPLDLPRQARKVVTASQEQRERDRDRDRHKESEKEREWEWDRSEVPPLPTREKRLSAAGYGRRASVIAPLPFSDLAPAPESSSSPTSSYSHPPPPSSVASHSSTGTSTEHVHAPVPSYAPPISGMHASTEAALLSSYSRALSPDAPALLPLLSSGSTSTVISAAASSSYRPSTKEEKKREKERLKRERERIEESGVLSPMSRHSKSKGKGRDMDIEETATFSSFGTSSSTGSRREKEEKPKPSARSATTALSALGPAPPASGIARARSMTVGGDSSFLNLASSREGSVTSELSGVKGKGKGKARAAMSVSEAGGVSVETLGESPSEGSTLWAGVQGPQQGVMTSTVSVGSGSGSSVSTKRDRDKDKACIVRGKEKEKKAGDGSEKDKDKKRGVFGVVRQLRPDKLVRGLDSALDFVDGRR